MKEAKEPVGLLLDKVPSFLVRNSVVVCRFCSVGISSLEEMVQHWKEERGREGLVERRVEKVPHAEVVMVAREEKRVEEKQEERGGLEKIQETEKGEGECIGGSTGEVSGLVEHLDDKSGNEERGQTVHEVDKEMDPGSFLLVEEKNETFEPWDGVTIERTANSELSENNLKQDNVVAKILCDMCEYSCHTRGAFQKHTLRKHAEIKQTNKIKIVGNFASELQGQKRKQGKLYQCSQCDYSNDAKVTFLTHKYKTHGLETPHQQLMCHMCDYRTYVPGQLKNHTEAKHDGRIFLCNQCDFKTHYQNSLRTHDKIHNEQSWLQCDLCAYRCATSGNMKTHMDGKHREVSLKSYPCPDCDSVFKTSPARSIHKYAVHLKIRHKCAGCDYSHASKQVVKKHFTAQHSNAIFSCPHCSFSSNWLAELQKHSRGKVLEFKNKDK